MKNNFKRGQRIIVGEMEFVIESRLMNGDIQLRNVVTNETVAKPMDYLIQQLFDGNLSMPDEIGSYAKRKAADILSKDFTQLADHLRAAAKRKFKYVREVINHGVDRYTKNLLMPIIFLVAEKIGDIKPPSVSSVGRWCRDYRTSGENIRSLVPLENKKGRWGSKLQPEVDKIIKDAIDMKYLTLERPTVDVVCTAVTTMVDDENKFRHGNDKLKEPDKSTIYRRIQKLDPYEVSLARFGKRITDLKFKQVRKSMRPTRPLERVEIDHTKLDLMVIDPITRMPIGRPWLTSAIDVFSKSIYGVYWSFTPPSYLSVTTMYIARNQAKNIH